MKCFIHKHIKDVPCVYMQNFDWINYRLKVVKTSQKLRCFAIFTIFNIQAKFSNKSNRDESH